MVMESHKVQRSTIYDYMFQEPSIRLNKLEARVLKIRDESVAKKKHQGVQPLPSQRICRSQLRSQLTRHGPKTSQSCWDHYPGVLQEVMAWTFTVAVPFGMSDLGTMLNYKKKKKKGPPRLIPYQINDRFTSEGAL